MTDPSLTELVRAEIIALHREFERWFAGSSDDFSRIRDSMAAGFTFISPGGTAIDHGDLLDGLEADHGSRRVQIRIENVAVRWSEDPAVLATYEEWQTAGGITTARQSTALFTKDPGAPGGLRWQHVHETWKLPPPV